MKPQTPTWRYWLNISLAVIGTVALGVIAIIIWLSYAQMQRYLSPPRVNASGDFLRANNIQYQEITLTTEDGIKLYAWYTPPQNGTVILVAHGQAATIPEDIYALFVRHGYGVLAWDFRSHGKSGGNFTSIGYYEVRDIKAALDYALAQPGVEHVGGWGGSMGAATMIRAAARHPQIER